MSDYPRHFPVVELQQTFYEPPSDKLLSGWRARMPPGFEMTIKAWQLITHEGKSPTYRRMKEPLSDVERASCGAFRDSAVVRRALTRTFECAAVVNATAVVFQSPSSFRPEADNVKRLRLFFERIANPQRPRGLRFCWEPRGAAWTEQADLAHTLCEELGLSYVVDPFVTPIRVTTAGPAYLRLHGVTGARHVYSDAELQHLAGITPPDAYVMFNNIPRARDAQRFIALLGINDGPVALTRARAARRVLLDESQS